MAGELVLDISAQTSDIAAARRVTGKVVARQPVRTEVQGHHVLRGFIEPDRELQRTPADVNRQQTSAAPAEPPPDCEEGQASLVLAIEDIQADSRRVLDSIKQ